MEEVLCFFGIIDIIHLFIKIFGKITIVFLFRELIYGPDI